MDQSRFEETVARLQEINAVLADLDPSIREAAFEVLRPYADGQVGKVVALGEVATTQAPSSDTLIESLFSEEEISDFLLEHAAGKPSENVKAITALIYGKYGTAQVTPADVTSIADMAGVTVPDRVDVTLSGLSHNKKRLFQKVQSGVYKPTVHGQKYFQDVYGVTKGTSVKRPKLSD